MRGLPSDCIVQLMRAIALQIIALSTISIVPRSQSGKGIGALSSHRYKVTEKKTFQPNVQCKSSSIGVYVYRKGEVK